MHVLQLLDTLQWYGREFKDPMMMNPPPWFKSFCVCEIFLQFPFFFPAALAFFNGKVLPADARRLTILIHIYVKLESWFKYYSEMY